jgi:hypothetical protein
MRLETADALHSVPRIVLDCPEHRAGCG